MPERKRLFRKQDHALVKLDKIERNLHSSDEIRFVKMKDALEIIVALRKLYYSDKDKPTTHQMHDLLVSEKELKFYSHKIGAPILTREDVLALREKHYPEFLEEIKKTIMKDTLEAAKPNEQSK